MKQSTVVISGIACAAGVAVSAMELPTFKLTYPSRTQNADPSVMPANATMPPGAIPGAMTMPPAPNSGGTTSMPSEPAYLPNQGPPISATAFLNKGPAVTGTKLGLKPGETATARALELQQELDQYKSREDDYRKRVADLEKEIEQKNSRLVEAIREMNSTRQELVAVKSQLEGWSQNMTDLREKIRSAEADNLATMQTIIQLLQQFLQVESDLKERSREPLDLEKLLDQTKGKDKKGGK